MYKNFRAIPYGIATLHGRFTAHRHHWNPNFLAGTKYHVAAADLLGQLAGGGLMFGFRINFPRSLSLKDIASPSGARTVAFKRSLRACRTWRGHLPSWASRSIPSRSILRLKTKWYFKVFSL
ncbi:hypothetical protein QT982_32220 [Microcoleus sp. herbarium2]